MTFSLIKLSCNKILTFFLPLLEEYIMKNIFACSYQYIQILVIITLFDINQFLIIVLVIDDGERTLLPMMKNDPPPNPHPSMCSAEMSEISLFLFKSIFKLSFKKIFFLKKIMKSFLIDVNFDQLSLRDFSLLNRTLMDM